MKRILVEGVLKLDMGKEGDSRSKCVYMDTEQTLYAYMHGKDAFTGWYRKYLNTPCWLPVDRRGE